MEKQIIKVITHAGANKEYIRNAMHYIDNEDSVGVRGYGVVERDPDTAAMQMSSTAKYYGNEGKNQMIHYMISLTRDTAPNAETAMEITDRALEPFKGKNQFLTGGHRKKTKQSEYHTHTCICTTNYETGKMLHSTNKINYQIAQRVADITQKTTVLIIETQKDIEEEKYSQSDNADSEYYNAKKKVFKRYFYPRNEDQ